MASGESVLTDAERKAILASAEALDGDREHQEQMLLLKIRQEGVDIPSASGRWLALSSSA